MKRRLMQQAAAAAAAAEGETGGYREKASAFVAGEAEDLLWDLQTELVRAPKLALDCWLEYLWRSVVPGQLLNSRMYAWPQ
jgi:hypothetical protein